MIESTAAHSGHEAAPGRVRAVVVLLRDRSADTDSLNDAIGIALRENARLLVVVAPRFSRWFASCFQLSGVPTPEWTPVQDQESQAIDRCVAMTLSTVPKDLPMTIRVATSRGLGAVLDTLEEFGDDWIGVGDWTRVGRPRSSAFRVGRRLTSRRPTQTSIDQDASGGPALSD